MILMALPLLQKIFHSFKESELQGAYIKPGQSKFTMEAIASQEFQKRVNPNARRRCVRTSSGLTKCRPNKFTPACSAADFRK